MYLLVYRYGLSLELTVSHVRTGNILILAIMHVARLAVLKDVATTHVANHTVLALSMSRGYEWEEGSKSWVDLMLACTKERLQPAYW